jgi:hypothetical protein
MNSPRKAVITHNFDLALRLFLSLNVYHVYSHVIPNIIHVPFTVYY